MKILSWLIAPLILFLSIFSCSKNNNNNTNRGALKAKFVAGTTVAAQQSSSTPRSTSDNSVIASLDIKSYNAKTGEVVFDKQPVLGNEWVNNRLKLNIYKDDTLLFGLTYSAPLYSFTFNEPVIYYNKDVDEGAGKWYILDGYPQGGSINYKNDHPLQQGWREERDASVKKIQSAWNVFINTLKIEGKYTE